MYVFVSMFKSLGQFFTFNDCLFFGAIISATDPGDFFLKTIFIHKEDDDSNVCSKLPCWLFSMTRK